MGNNMIRPGTVTLIDTRTNKPLQQLDVPSTERIYIGSFTKIIIKPFDDKRVEFTFYPEDKDGDGHANGTQVFSPETKITLRSYSNQNVFSRDAVTDGNDIPIMTGYYTVTSVVTEP